jgi:hypothetical protein
MVRGGEPLPVQIERHQNARKSYQDDGAAFLDLARNTSGCMQAKNRLKNAAF